MAQRSERKRPSLLGGGEEFFLDDEGPATVCTKRRVTVRLLAGYLRVGKKEMLDNLYHDLCMV
jgi:hypothetical protein